MTYEETWELFKQEKVERKVLMILRFMELHQKQYLMRFKILKIHNFNEYVVVHHSKLSKLQVEQVKAFLTRSYMLGLPKLEVE